MKAYSEAVCYGLIKIREADVPMDQLVLVPVDKTIPSLSASGVYPLEKAQELLDRLGLGIPIKIDDQSY